MDDCISRKAVLEMAYDMSEIDGEHFTEPCMVVDVEDIQKLSPVNPQEPCEDFISRQAVIDIIHRFFTEEVNKIPTKKTEDGEVYDMHKCQPLFEMNKAICKRIKALPSATAERTGHWINITEQNLHDYRTGNKLCFECDQCHHQFTYSSNFCPDCGSNND